MIHTLRQIAESRFLVPEEFLAFCAGKEDAHGITSVGGEPVTSTWFVDDLVDAFIASGGRRLTHDEIVEKYRK
jgi:pyruvate-formate lyase-activating enzyme